MFKNTFIFLLFHLAILHHVNAQNLSIKSPDGDLKLTFFLDSKGAPHYQLDFKNKAVLETSNLGFAISNAPDLMDNFEIVEIDSGQVREAWNPVWGEVKTITDDHNELVVHLREKSDDKRELTINFRLFDDGLGFRYEFGHTDKLHHFVIEDEMTTFNLTGDHKMWWMPGDFDTNEYNYYISKISEVAKLAKKKDGAIFTATPLGGTFVQTPVQMKSDDGLYINIFEAALVDYPAMDLHIDSITWEAETKLAPDAVGNKAYMQAPCHTPWRTVLVSDDARDILASKTILNLNEPSKIEDPSWIKPMKYCGIWLEMHLGLSSWDYAGTQDAQDAGTDSDDVPPAERKKHGATTANTKKYIDFAAKNKFGGVLVEGWNTGWEDWFGYWKEDVFDFVTPYPDYDLPLLSQYAKSKGVTLITHHETSASVTNYERWMDTAYTQMNKYGSTALKSGYVGRIIPRGEYHDGQWMVRHYLRAIDKAADKKIMVVAHEPVRPTGLHRTYPNFMAAEAARGNEFNFWSEGNFPAHETILPFTRLMGGPMDYTPGIFKIKKSEYYPGATEQVHTTLTKQLALYITIYSPIQMATDLPENYEAHPDAFQFIRDVPVDWDDTKILEAEPGEYVCIARKGKGTHNWFVGGISNQDPRKMKVKLDFLDPGKKYNLTCYRDADNASWDKNPEAYKIEKKVVTNKSTLDLNIAPGGGFAISIIEK